MTIVAGLIVDRVNRKYIIIFSDLVAAITTLFICYLYSTHQLQVWHLYIIAAIKGASTEIQTLTYSASISLLVTKQHYTRATSMNSAIHYGSIIIAPALAGVLYYSIDITGILLIDLFTFIIAIASIIKLHIPQPTIIEQSQYTGFWRGILFGFHYLMSLPSLLTLLTASSLFWFAHDIGATLFSPMILARTDNNAKVLGSISSAAGLGGVTGTLLLSIWGGSRRRIHGFLLGMIGAGVSKTIFGLSQGLITW